MAASAAISAWVDIFPVGFECKVLCPTFLLAFAQGEDLLVSLTGAVFLAEVMFAMMGDFLADGDFFATLVGADFFAEVLVRGDLVSEGADDKATEVPISLFENIMFEACAWKKSPTADTHSALFAPDFGGENIIFCTCVDEMLSRKRAVNSLDIIFNCFTVYVQMRQ
jgi:hypothetical protein